MQVQFSSVSKVQIGIINFKIECSHDEMKSIQFAEFLFFCIRPGSSFMFLIFIYFISGDLIRRNTAANLSPLFRVTF